MKFFFNTMCLLVTLFMINACDSGLDSQKGDSALSNSTSLSLSLAALKKQPSLGESVSHNSSKELSFAASDVMTGTMVVTNTADDSTSDYFWSVYFDSDTYEAQSNKTINLFPGIYNFSLLLEKGDQQYIGSALAVTIVDGTNDVAMTIKPIIGDTITDMSLVGETSELSFQYPADELSEFSLPKLGVIIDSDPEIVLDINPTTGLSSTYVNTPKGEHSIKLKFYDGNVQKGKSKPEQETVNISLGTDLVMDLIPLHGETVFTLTEDGGDAYFGFHIPSEVVDEVEGTANLRAIFSIVGPKNPFREIELMVDPSGDDYHAETTLTNYQYDTVSYTVTFSDTRNSEQVAECVVNGIDLSVNSSTQTCDITLRRSAVVSGNLYGVLGVNVFNTMNEPVAGAKVYAIDTSGDDQLLGFTGNGYFGTEGYLKAFLKAGNYTIRAEDSSNGYYGENSIAAEVLDVDNVDIFLIYELIQYLTWDQNNWTVSYWN